MAITHRNKEIAIKLLKDMEGQFILGELFYEFRKAGLDPVSESTRGVTLYTKGGNATSPKLVYKILRRLGYTPLLKQEPVFPNEGGKLRLQRGVVIIDLMWFSRFDGERNAPQVNVTNYT